MIGAINSSLQYVAETIQIPKIAHKATMVGVVALLALANLPVANADESAYRACVQSCMQTIGMVTGWHTLICPIICAPSLALPIE